MIHSRTVMMQLTMLSTLLFAFLLGSLFKLSYMVGSYWSFFSAASVVSSLAGLSGGAFGVVLLFALRVLKIVIFKNSFCVSYWAQIIPGIFGGLYWSGYSFAIRCVVPALCILLFVLHPIGFWAAPYSFYWLLPIVVYASKTHNLFLHALGSTFVAHAAGSVIWLYTVPMTSALWLSLIPVVLVERVIFASGIVAGYLLLTCLKKIIIRNVYANILLPLSFWR